MERDRSELARARAATRAGASDEAVGFLAKLLGDPSEVVRLGAVYGLVNADTERAWAWLERAAERDPSREVRETARDELALLRARKAVSLAG